MVHVAGEADPEPCPPAAVGARSWLVALAVWGVGAIVFFRDAIFSGFDTVTGDRGDLRLIVFVNEHWWQVLHGDAAWRTPPMFHPTEGVLGYSDTFGLYQLAYLPLRSFGVEAYVAFQLTLIALTLLGFTCTFAILRRHLHLATGPACLLGCAAAFSNNLYVDTGHPQMYAVAFVPAVALLAVEGWRARTARRRIARAAASGLVAGLLVWTAFYIGWFVLVLGGATTAAAVVAGIAGGRRADIVAAVRERWAAIAVWFGGLLVGLVPFAATYLPVLSDARSRNYREVMSFAPRPLDVVNVGRHNLVWGRIVEPLLGGDARLDQLHRNVAVTPLLVVAAVLGGASLGSRWWCARRHRPVLPVEAIGIALAAVALITVFVPVQFGFGGAWAWFHRFVPGGDAIRVYGRIEVVNSLLAVGAVGCWWSTRRPVPHGSSTVRRILPLVVLASIAVEQVNTTTDFRRLDRGDELASLASVPRAPGWCDWFVLVDPIRDGVEEHTSIDAILIAQRERIPTLNGYSGQVPPGWRLKPWDDGYDAAIDDWLTGRAVGGTGCEYDQSERRWRRRARVTEGA